MKSEMYEFLLHTLGADIPEVLHMRAPHGQTVLDPRPSHPHGSGYRTHPELSRPVYAAVSAYAYHNPYVSGIGVSVAPAVAMVTATATYPTVAGSQYQSAISGQPSIGVDLGTLQETSGSRRGFKWYQLGYWRGY